MKTLKKLLLPALVAAAVGTAGLAKIERLNLEQMVSRTDNALYAEIVAKRVFRVDHPVDGPELYYTTLTLKGNSLRDGRAVTVDVTYPGGFIDKEKGIGVFNSEAPSEDDVRMGNKVVAFYRWSDNIGGDVAANVLYASHGGLFRTVDGPQGTVVLGRGEGYAVSKNRGLGDLDTAVRTFAKAHKKQ